VLGEKLLFSQSPDTLTRKNICVQDLVENDGINFPWMQILEMLEIPVVADGTIQRD
jgi:hypothetical protein